VVQAKQLFFRVAHAIAMAMAFADYILRTADSWKQKTDLRLQTAPTHKWPAKIDN